MIKQVNNINLICYSNSLLTHFFVFAEIEILNYNGRVVTISFSGPPVLVCYSGKEGGDCIWGMGVRPTVQDEVPPHRAQDGLGAA